ncbi:MAG: sulfite exporter TauE/SafE family protein [Kofleriaceae bacterium]
MSTVLALVIAISFIATLVRSTFGFGESLVAVPLFALLIPIDVAVPLAVAISILVALIAVLQDRREIDLESAKWLIIFALLGIPIGLGALVYADAFYVKLALGTLITAYAAYSLASRRTAHLEQDSRAWLFACGFLSGVLGGAYGLNGPPLVVYGNLRRWSATQFRATLQAYFLPASLLGLAGYATQGLVTRDVGRYFALCLPATVPAVFLGRYLNRKLQAASFFRYVYVGLFAIGALLVAFTLAHVRTG